VGIRHILASPFHFQTSGKLERCHRTIKLDVNQIPYDVPGHLEIAITEFVNYYNNRRYHKALGNVTPSVVLDGRREEILERLKEAQTQTRKRRRIYRQRLREIAQSALNLQYTGHDTNSVESVNVSNLGYYINLHRIIGRCLCRRFWPIPLKLDIS
jgi:hypothetical protein